MRTLVCWLVVLSAFGALALPLTGAAATLTVNTTADDTTSADGHCTLREAVANVNSVTDRTGGDCVAGTGTGDTINFNLALPAKIKFKLGQLAIGRNVTITGPTTGLLRIVAHGSRLFEITAGATNMSDLTLERGSLGCAASAGSGIRVDSGASLALVNCTLSRNNGISGGCQTDGGAIYNAGTTNLTNCTLSSNRGANGGAIYNASGTMTLTNSTFKRNKAGSSNVLGFGVDYGYGGAIYNASGTMTLTNSTFSRNTGLNQVRAGNGGGIYNGSGTMNLTNCTLSRNNSNGGSGTYNAAGTMTLTNCTLSRNKGHCGVFNGGTMILTNTIVANDSKGGDCCQAVTSNGHNLGSDATCFTSGGTDLVNTDPMLAPLANYGGPTDTLALCVASGVPVRSCKNISPAIDAGDDTVVDPPYNLTTDQCGMPRKAALHVDIGAYEVQ